MRDWDYEFDDCTLTIRVKVRFTMDLLPSILEEIFNAVWLETIEKVTTIKVERTHSRDFD